MPRFKKIYIETTNICNLSCNFCPKTERKLGFTNTLEFREIIQKIKNHTNYVYFHLMGEPLLNKNFGEFIKIANDEKINVNITTNGTLINKVKNVIINGGKIRQINISLHSFEANNIDLDFDKYINDILDFMIEANEKTETIVALRLWNMDTEENLITILMDLDHLFLHIKILQLHLQEEVQQHSNLEVQIAS